MESLDVPFNLTEALGSPDEWSRVADDLEAEGVLHGIPLGFLFFPVTGRGFEHIRESVKLLGRMVDEVVRQKIGGQLGDAKPIVEMPGGQSLTLDDGTIHIIEMLRRLYAEDESDEIEPGWRIRRKDWCPVTLYRRQGQVVNILETGEGREKRVKMKRWLLGRAEWRRLNFLAKTFLIRENSTLAEAEEKARENLRQKITPAQWRSLLISDCFFERGRSGVDYLIRRNRPTIAMRRDGDGHRPLCALCLHPYVYYEGSWAGSMPPSDEMLTHVLYIRASEPLYWRQANQLSFDMVCSGV